MTTLVVVTFVLSAAALSLCGVACVAISRARRRNREITTRLDILRAVVDGSARREREDA